MNCGDAFMIEDDDQAKEHLHIVLSKPNNRGELVTASICTQQSRSEILVCLGVGDHPFISRPSVVPYRHARIRRVGDIESAIKNGTARPRERASRQVVSRMQAGLLDSAFVANEVRAFYRECEGQGLHNYEE